MKNALLLTNNQPHFLNENRQDPITGDSFEIGDEIVFCASCKSAFLKESWEYMQGKHCNQNKTLSNFPITSYLFLTKAIIYNFEKADNHSRICAYLVDIIAGVMCGVIGMAIMSCFINPFATYNYGLAILIAYMIFKDALLKNKSFGKWILGVYFINKATKNKNVIAACFFRNSIYWIAGIASTCVLFGMRANNEVFYFQFYFFCVLHSIYLVITLLENNFFDRFMGIELVQKRENK